MLPKDSFDVQILQEGLNQGETFWRTTSTFVPLWGIICLTADTKMTTSTIEDHKKELWVLILVPFQTMVLYLRLDIQECWVPPSFQTSQDAMPSNTYNVVHITGNTQLYTKPKYTHFITSNSWTKGAQARSKQHVQPNQTTCELDYLQPQTTICSGIERT
jgi:hypothetical protein